MDYYVRVLSTSSAPIPFPALKKALAGLKCRLIIEESEEDEELVWEQLLLSHTDGHQIAVIERNVVEVGSLGAEELDEFREELEEALPRSGAEWLAGFFNRVQCIYACQILSGVEHMNGWEIFAEFKNALWRRAPSILQADLEGFTNEDGYHILWRYSDTVKGSWWMGLLVDGEWKHFEMDRGDHSQREAYFRGEIPAGVKMA